MKKLLMILALVLTSISLAYSTPKNWNKETSTEKPASSLTPEQKSLLVKYQMAKDSSHLKDVKQATLKLAQKSVPVLVTVMKGTEYPDQARWLATFMLGRVMGRKSASYIAKYTTHPNWMLRVAAFKVLVALDQKDMLSVYGQGLKDSSMLVRLEALGSISRLKIKELSPLVWKMVYDESNYSVSQGKRKRTDVVREAIRALGDLGYRESQRPLIKMIKNKSFDDIFDDLDTTLSKLAQTSSPRGNRDVKRAFWGNYLKSKTF